MELKIRDIVVLLQISEKTLYRWIKDKKIPCYRINHQYRFNRAEINEWILSNKIDLSSRLINLAGSQRQDSLSHLLEKGGIITGIIGESVSEVLQSAIEKIETPRNIPKNEILNALLSREELMPTAIGRGIAIPHPRNPIVTDVNNARVSICCLDKPIDFGSLDKLPVHTLFILFTVSPKMHLEVLSKISYLCQDEKFLYMLKTCEPTETILEYIRDKEKDWNKKESVSQ
jgi:PTS system nitrogen regulatory IIA component